MGNSLWSRVYWGIFGILLLGLILKNKTIIAIAVTGYMVIFIMASEADRNAEKKLRRKNLKKLPDDKLTRDLQSTMIRLEQKEKRDKETHRLTSGMGSVGSLDDVRRK